VGSANVVLQGGSPTFVPPSGSPNGLPTKGGLQRAVRKKVSPNGGHTSVVSQGISLKDAPPTGAKWWFPQGGSQGDSQWGSTKSCPISGLPKVCPKGGPTTGPPIRVSQVGPRKMVPQWVVPDRGSPNGDPPRESPIGGPQDVTPKRDITRSVPTGGPEFDSPKVCP
jgi:hypothetical protein